MGFDPRINNSDAIEVRAATTAAAANPYQPPRKAGSPVPPNRLSPENLARCRAALHEKLYVVPNPVQTVLDDGRKVAIRVIRDAPTPPSPPAVDPFVTVFEQMKVVPPRIVPQPGLLDRILAVFSRIFSCFSCGNREANIDARVATINAALAVALPPAEAPAEAPPVETLDDIIYKDDRPAKPLDPNAQKLLRWKYI